MELTHEFTVPAAIEETWTAFNDIESVAACFPGAEVTSVEGDTFQGSVKVKLGPIALVYNGSGTFVEKDESAHRMVIDAKGKDKRGNGTAGAHVTATMTDAGHLDPGRGAHRPGHHRQAGPVRPRGDAGRQRQAARPVHRLPRAEGGGSSRAAADAEAAADAADRPRPRPSRRRTAPGEQRARPRRRADRTRPATSATTPSTSAPPCCRCWRRATGSRRSASCSCCRAASCSASTGGCALHGRLTKPDTLGTRLRAIPECAITHADWHG